MLCQEPKSKKGEFIFCKTKNILAQDARREGNEKILGYFREGCAKMGFERCPSQTFTPCRRLYPLWQKIASSTSVSPFVAEMEELPGRGDQNNGKPCSTVCSKIPGGAYAGGWGLLNPKRSVILNPTFSWAFLFATAASSH